MRDRVGYGRTARCGEQRAEGCIKTSKNKCCLRKAFLLSFTGRVASGSHTAEKVVVFGLSQGEVISLNTLGTQPTSQKGGCLRNKCHTGTVATHPGTERNLHRNTVTRSPREGPARDTHSTAGKERWPATSTTHHAQVLHQKLFEWVDM